MKDKTSTAEESPRKTLAISPSINNFTYREGPALDPKSTAPKSINIVGTLPAPADFLDGKSTVAHDDDIHLKIYKDIGKLELVIKDTDPYTTHTIVGQLTRDGRLTEFGINTTKRWAIRDFVNFIKARRFFFTSGDDHSKLLTSLNKWNARVETIIQDQREDKSGSSLFHLEKKVTEVDLLNKFSLTIPIYQGYPKNTFQVEIGLEPQANAVSLYLLSDDLFRLDDEFRESIMEKELARFKDRKFSKVVVS